MEMTVITIMAMVILHLNLAIELMVVVEYAKKGGTLL